MFANAQSSADPTPQREQNPGKQKTTEKHAAWREIHGNTTKCINKMSFHLERETLFYHMCAVMIHRLNFI